MDEIAEKFQSEYDKMYDKYKKESICLNKNNWNTYKHFSFLFRGSYLTQFISSVSCKEFDFSIYKKTNDCKIIIDSIHTLIRFKLLVKNLKSGIKVWEHAYHNYKWLIADIKEKAIVDVLKEEISFMENRIKFKLLFLK